MNDAEFHSRLSTLAEESGDSHCGTAGPEGNPRAEAIASESGVAESAPFPEHDTAANSDLEYEQR